MSRATTVADPGKAILPLGRRRWSRLTVTLAGLLALGPLSARSSAQEVRAPETPNQSGSWLPVQPFELDNGVRLHVVRRPLSSWVSAGWAVRSGAADDPVGASGTAHLVEHLLYTGSTRVGTRDWRAEEPLLEQEARWMEQQLEADTPAVRRQLADVRARLGQLQLPGDLTRRWIAAGIRSEGALTTKDFTLYRASFPREALETWMNLEAERMARPAFRLLDREQDVVLEENLQRVASVPQAPVEERFDRYFWGSSPYGRPPDDPRELVRVLRGALEAFHERHYRAANLVISVVGDVDAEAVLDLARRSFGTLEGGAVGRDHATGDTAPRAVGLDGWAAQPGGGRDVARCDCRPSARIRFATVPYDDESAVAFDVLAAILNGRSGRLMLGLVDPRSDVFAGYASHKAQSRAGTFSVVAETAEESVGVERLAEIATALREQLARLVVPETRVRSAEVQRARNMLLSSAAREVKASDALRSRLLIDDALGDGDRLRRWRERVESVTVEELVALVQRFFLPGAGEEDAPGVEFFVLHGDGSVTGSTDAGGGP